MGIILISKLQIFDKGENRYVLFGATKQHNLREFFSAKLVKSFAELFQKRPFFICYFSPINQNLKYILKMPIEKQSAFY